MKELYSFDITRDIVTKTPYKKKTKKGEVEAFKNKTSKKKTKIIKSKCFIVLLFGVNFRGKCTRKI